MTFDAEVSFRIELMGRSSGIVVVPAQDVEMANYSSGARYVGFGTQTGGRVDFAAAPVIVGASGAAVPNWQGPLIVRLQGEICQRSDFKSVRILDLVFFRKFLADTTRGTIKFWYRPAFADSIFPADPMFPWGRDFYKFLRHILG